MLKDIISELKHYLYNIPTREQTLGVCIKDKLDKSYDNYATNLEKTYKYLLYRSNIKVLKTIDREQKKALKEEEEDWEDDDYGE